MRDKGVQQRVLLLLLLLGFYAYRYVESCEVKNPNQVYKKIKSGTLTVSMKSDKITLKIQKNEKSASANPSSLEMVLFTKDPAATTLAGDSRAVYQLISNCEQDTICVKVRDVVHTKILAAPQADAVKIKRLMQNPDGSLTDCIRLDEDAQWVGGPQWRYQHWPVQHQYYEEEPYVPTHQNQAAVIERYWLSSRGFYIYGSPRDPLFVDQNNLITKHLCLVAKNRAPYHRREQIELDYEIGVFSDARMAHEYVVLEHLGKPMDIPDERMVAEPIWSTWARYKVYVNDSVVREFAKEIRDNGFGNSQLEIDDNWETCYGSAEFNATKFPDVLGLTDDLHSQGFRVTLWVHPFINRNCAAYDYAVEHDYAVKNLEGSVKSEWWQGNDSLAIDFTNLEAVQWWVGRLRKITDLGVDSFKFDAGEETFTAQPVPDLQGDEDLQPGLYTNQYVTALWDNFNSMIEVRVGWRTQDLPIFVRMIDKDSRWTLNNGLPTLVTTLLQMNLQGYVFVLPDMIGGNGYVPGDITLTAKPSKEIFIRWLQANTFMPSLQFSFVPWDYDDETIKISKKFTQLHTQIAPKVIDRMKLAVQTGAPVNPPIWWVDPEDQEAHKVSDEYLLGEEVLVAPVIHEGSLSRDVYLPKGRWRDGNDNKEYSGPLWINDYEAPIDVLPHFYKIA
ncbi:myogenesis-regulating glycosidase [Trichogramma pretiosum]|uniref:myogenesis-regulating glycosidase n=1 Tax=Trichogramma pretiosum TaxID=7493 RepID=UPI0006C9CABB|nr:myogenesis-regulating glycosidase [Trichogramma pretiosum]